MKLIIPAQQAELMISHYVSQEMQIYELGSMPKVTFISSPIDDPHFIVEHGESIPGEEE